MTSVMSRNRTLPIRVALAVALAAVLLAAAPARAQTGAWPVIEQPFFVESVDGCLLGYAKGTLGWERGPAIRQVVYVNGTVADQVNSTCGIRDGRYTLVTFTAYQHRTAVDRQQVRVDDAEVSISFDLVGLPTIDWVGIVLCRLDPARPSLPECAEAAYRRPF